AIFIRAKRMGKIFHECHCSVNRKAGPIKNVTMQKETIETPTLQKQAIGNFRWSIRALIFFATTINYLDRAVISLLKSYLEKDFNWTESDYSHIVIAFQVSYACGLLVAGSVID